MFLNKPEEKAARAKITQFAMGPAPTMIATYVKFHAAKSSSHLYQRMSNFVMGTSIMRQAMY